MQRAVKRRRTVPAYLLAGVIVVAGAFQAGAFESPNTEIIRPAEVEKYDWEGTWQTSYKKELSGPDFTWAFVRINDEFQARFAFSVDARGNVSGVAHSRAAPSSQREAASPAAKEQATTAFLCASASNFFRPLHCRLRVK